KIEGKKPYSDWKLKEVFREILGKDYRSLEDMPILDLDDLPPLERPFPEIELRNFVWDLQRSLEAFDNAVNTNGRIYINSFMTTAVRHIKASGMLVRLSVATELDGSRGYGPIDYMVNTVEIVVVTAKAKEEKMNKGSAEVMVQIQSAIEQQLR